MVRGLMRSDRVKITNYGGSAVILVLLRLALVSVTKNEVIRRRGGWRYLREQAFWACQRLSVCILCIVSTHATAYLFLKTESHADMQRWSCHVHCRWDCPFDNSCCSCCSCCCIRILCYYWVQRGPT